MTAQTPGPPKSYQPPEFAGEVRLPLSRNESRPTLDAGHLAGAPLEAVCQYPSQKPLQESLGQWLGLDPERIVISAGGDDALERVIRLAIRGGRSRIVTHAPSFEMVGIYTALHGGELDTFEWSAGAFPTAEMIGRFDDQTGLAIVVSPNNPTGATLPLSEVLSIAEAAQSRGLPLLVDHAYIEFAAQDDSAELWNHPNVLVLRTLSKAWGLAGLRTGFLVAPTPEQAAVYRAATGPFPVSGLSLELARQAVEQTPERMKRQVAAIRHNRDQLRTLLIAAGLDVAPSEGNFLLVRTPDAEALWRELAEAGIATRRFPDNPLLLDALRITIPPGAADFLHLAKTFHHLRPTSFDLGQLAVEPESLPPESDAASSTPRTAVVERSTKETSIRLELDLDGSGQTQIQTGIGFFDHMLTALAFHSRFDLTLECQGDLEVDDHHTVEDCALALGTAIDQALGPRTGIVRFGFAYAPLDEALARTVIDLSGRPWPAIDLKLEREQIGQLATENLTHFFISLAMNLKCSLHVDVLRGDNDHHRAEAAFKSLALALRTAVARTAGSVPSTKGVL